MAENCGTLAENRLICQCLLGCEGYREGGHNLRPRGTLTPLLEAGGQVNSVHKAGSINLNIRFPTLPIRL